MPRSYRRRYYSRKRSYYRRYTRRIPKAIGTGQSNFVQACFTVEQGLVGNVDEGEYYMKEPLSVMPFNSQMVNVGMTYFMADWSGIAGLYNSYSFRKMLTMYQEMKVNGVYLQITITPATDSGVYSIYTTWDRMTTIDDASKYKTNYPNSWQGQIKGNANEQGGRQKTVYPEKGTSTYFTKCVAKNTNEKQSWVSTDTFHTELAIPVMEDTYYHHVFAAQQWRTATTPCFCPIAFIAIERSTYAPVGGAKVHINIKMRTYCSFRNPGVSRNTYTLQRILLQDNEELAPSTSDGAKRAPPIPGDVAEAAEKRLLGERSTEYEPATKKGAGATSTAAATAAAAAIDELLDDDE